MNTTYGVYPTGGSIGSAAHNSMPVAVYSDKEIAKQHAARLRKLLSPGERGYYGMSYVVKPITTAALRSTK